MKHQFLTFMFVMVCINLGLLYISNEQEKKSKIRNTERLRVIEENCNKDNKCLDKRAKRESSKGTKKIIRSKTGNYFFSGVSCSGNCSGHIAGYNWAEEKSYSKPDLDEDDCFSKSSSFSEGCDIFLEDYLYDVCFGNLEPFPYESKSICNIYQ